MPESWSTRLERWGFNWFPAYRGTGGRVTYIAHDWREVRVEIPLSRRTRNYVGTIFGGSLYGAVDPVYMVMFIKNLGREFIVWDKAASIRFRRPGRATLYARFLLGAEEIASVRDALETHPTLERSYRVDLADAAGTVHASVEKTLYFGRRTVVG